jgi:hypothetical protein
MGVEELLITRIENDLRGLRLKTKTFEQVDVRPKLIRLKKTNPDMADELEQKYLRLISRGEDNFLSAKKSY